MDWMNTQRARIERGELLAAESLAGLALDALLDRRDDTAFATRWNIAFAAIEARWHAADNPAREVDKTIDRLRKAAFKAVSRATAQHAIAAYVSDDFELIARAHALGYEDPFVAALWATYEAGRIPA